MAAAVANKKKLFLAGSTGLVGTAILQRLLTDRPDISISASRRDVTDPWLTGQGIEYVTGDLNRLETCRQMIRGCDCAIMAAAFTGGAAVVNSFPWRHIKENLNLNMQMLEAVQLENVRRLIVMGSATLYQDDEGMLSEGDLDLNKDPAPSYMGYGWTARFIEKMCRFVHDKFGTQIVIVRAANIFGPYARFDPANSNVIPALIRKAVDKNDPFEVWGTPSVTRDVIYSEDFAEAIVKLLDWDESGFEIFNVGSGQRTTVDQLVRWTLNSASHQPSSVTYVKDSPTTMKNRWLDCSKIRSALDWAPHHTIEEGITETTRWWIENKSWWKR